MSRSGYSDDALILLKRAVYLAENPAGALPTFELATEPPSPPRMQWLSAPGTVPHAFLGESVTSLCGHVSRYRQQWEPDARDCDDCKHCQKQARVTR